MGTKNTTKQVVGREWEEASWNNILVARARDLAYDNDHTFSHKDQAQISKATTRKQIVQMYEDAYSELAESFHGHLEHINELEADKSRLNTLLSDLDTVSCPCISAQRTKEVPTSSPLPKYRRRSLAILISLSPSRT